MTANTPPKPHAEGDKFTNTETGIEYEFKSGAWRAIGSEAADAVVDALNNINLQTVLDNGNVADKALAIQTEKGVSVLEDQALRITHQDNPYIRLVDEADMDSVEISLKSDHAHIDLSDENDELHFKFAGTEKVTFTNTAATFQEPVIVDMPNSVSQPFIIKGTANTGTVNSNVLFVQNSSNRTSVRYRGLVEHEYDLANKAYVDNVQFKHPGMGLQWRWTSGSVSPGCFYISESKFIRISHTTYGGRDIFKKLCSSDRGVHADRTIVNIYKIVDGEMEIHEVFNVKNSRFGRNVNSMEFEYDAKASAIPLTNNDVYYISIGGLC